MIKRYDFGVDDFGDGTPFRNDHDGRVVFYEDHAAEVARLNEQVRALAAESTRMKDAIKKIFPAGVDDENGKIGFSDAAKECYASSSETPATAAILNEVRARAVDAYCDEMDRNGVVTPRDFAARIRAGEVQNG